ncbi:MAG: protein-(glutamine-N5) methyltransferase, release factor-specific [Candidatus Staskawiczbacteria bacterium RIFCSPHIGHO2_02_FULL_42_22]|uniref:peptide chain release factor N(5)-glutamine methyltransferase n=1 Tax=Candidatus Staskawiczbacteria bacterium RIFCSPHIGHO2_02_FULL_42_22 TaxID=1802207 RepID=A0A1G2I460_9BACT|nr:MAG: protein-(glutamine-N5) methyltransferase, release factor-specific [Candidatus Staskawiczbacteria bacterium RIFCSPHIGHO2_02_FULL_42_22]
MEKEINWLLKEKYHGKPNTAFYKDIERLKKGEPLGYVIGFTDFLGCKIDVSKKPLIPRPETEFWTQGAIEKIYSDSRSFGNRSIRVLDIFAGSGCIGISIMRQIKGLHVTFAEKAEKLIKQIKTNCKLNNIPKTQYKVIQSDIFLNVKGRFDYIFANPPYIPKNRKNKIQPSVLTHEPHEALFGGSDGLLYIRKFLAEAKNFLNKNGKIYMEFDPPQKKEIEVIIKNYGYKNYRFHKDQYRKWRWVEVWLVSSNT